jgi:Uma2 family endonuclease
MGTAALVSVEEYLNTSYQDGDREYVDGLIVERNVGELEHADIQGLLILQLSKRYPSLWVRPEVRVQVSALRFRVPDVVIVNGPRPEGRIITAPPLAVAEVLSPDDRAVDLEEKIADYLSFGIRHVWVINPHTRRAHIHTPDGAFEAKDGHLWTRDPEIRLPLSDLFY